MLKLLYAFYLNKNNLTEKNLIGPFCDDKHFAAAASGLSEKLKKSI